MRELPRGTAVFGANDYFIRQAYEFCLEEGLEGTGELSLLGVDADEDIHIGFGRPINSIDPGPEAIGEAAAELLGRLMSGEAVDPGPRWIPPRGIEDKGNTPFNPDLDPHLHAALTFIQDHPGILLTVDEVVRVTGIGRRALEMRFQAALGTGIAQHVRNGIMDLSRRLLRDPALRVAEVAERVGYSDLYHFSSAFKKEHGKSPTQWRRDLAQPTLAS
jgi:LacI family transcriptional regulator